MADVLTLEDVLDRYRKGDWSIPEPDQPQADIISGRRRKTLFLMAEAFEDFGARDYHDACMEQAALHNEAYPAKWRVGKSRAHDLWHSPTAKVVIFHEKHGDYSQLATDAWGMAGIYLRRMHLMLEHGWFDSKKPDVPDPQLDLLKPAPKIETRSEEEIVQDVLNLAVDYPEMQIPCGRWAAAKVHERDACEYGRITVDELTPAGPYRGDPWE